MRKVMLRPHYLAYANIWRRSTWERKCLRRYVRFRVSHTRTTIYRMVNDGQLKLAKISKRKQDYGRKPEDGS